MTPLLPLALLIVAPPQEMVEIRVTGGPEMGGLQNSETIIRGTCRGRPASATITRASARDFGTQDLRAIPLHRWGRLVLRFGRWAREVPPAFLNGSLVTNGLYWTGLACDGRRLQLSALAIRRDARGEIVMDAQKAVMDLRTGALSVTELRTLSPAETRSELRQDGRASD